MLMVTRMISGIVKIVADGLRVFFVAVAGALFGPDSHSINRYRG